MYSLVPLNIFKMAEKNNNNNIPLVEMSTMLATLVRDDPGAIGRAVP